MATTYQHQSYAQTGNPEAWYQARLQEAYVGVPNDGYRPPSGQDPRLLGYDNRMTLITRTHNTRLQDLSGRNYGIPDLEGILEQTESGITTATRQTVSAIRLAMREGASVYRTFLPTDYQETADNAVRIYGDRFAKERHKKQAFNRVPDSLKWIVRGMMDGVILDYVLRDAPVLNGGPDDPEITAFLDSASNGAARLAMSVALDSVRWDTLLTAASIGGANNPNVQRLRSRGSSQPVRDAWAVGLDNLTLTKAMDAAMILDDRRMRNISRGASPYCQPFVEQVVSATRNWWANISPNDRQHQERYYRAQWEQRKGRRHQEPAAENNDTWAGGWSNASTHSGGNGHDQSGDRPFHERFTEYTIQTEREESRQRYQDQLRDVDVAARAMRGDELNAILDKIPHDISNSWLWGSNPAHIQSLLRTVKTVRELRERENQAGRNITDSKIFKLFHANANGPAGRVDPELDKLFDILNTLMGGLKGKIPF